MAAPEPYPLQLEAGLPLKCPAFALAALRVQASAPALRGEIAKLGDELRAKWRDVNIGEISGIAPVRACYRALGIDPTKTRPSSEALLRRVLKGQELYTVNTLVDALNLCSLRFLVPFGLYDLDKVKPPVELRRGREGEGYAGIRKDRVNVAGRPCLADMEGPFGNPTSDSERTSIALATTRALVVPFLPIETDAARTDEIVRETARVLAMYSA
ncbi:MAG: phenylalanine--tRNA ligase beta subunit-related protein [Planctomycetota bacterium]|nr:phenylalanine--tRNA ligase beta subunit-related protein [Planctomycetota bacterium]